MPRALDSAQRSRRIPPVAVLGIGTDQCGTDNTRIPDLFSVLEESLSWAQHYAATQERSFAGKQKRVLAAQGHNGLAALAAIAHVNEKFGALSVSSPSWYGADTHPRAYVQIEQTQHFLSTISPLNLRIRISTGLKENSLGPYVYRLVQGMDKHGWEVTFTRYQGGYDPAWWRGALIDDIHAFLGA